jgi:hypothetical protein
MLQESSPGKWDASKRFGEEKLVIWQQTFEGFSFHRRLNGDA